MAILEWADSDSSGWVDRADTEWVDGNFIAKHRVALSQVFDLVNRFHRHFLIQPYYLSDTVRVQFVTVYSIKLMNILTQYYGDNPKLRVALRQWYWDAVQHRKKLVQEYGEAPAHRVSFEANYHLFRELLNDVIQKYSVTGTLLEKDFISVWDVISRGTVSKELNQLYLILGGMTDNDISMPEVLLENTAITVDSINFEASLDYYCVSATLGFKDYALYKKCKLGDSIQITVDTDVVNLFVESKQRARQVQNPIQYYINCLSLSAKMDAPYSLGIEGDLGPAWASAIADTVVTASGLTLEWDIVDQFYAADIFFGNGDTPLAILKRLATPTKGRVQTLLDGTVRIIPHYPDSPTTWGTVTPEAYLTDAQDFFSTGEQPDIRPGFNKFLITDTITPEAFDRLEEEEISASKKYIRAYQVPWQEGTDIPFSDSGGDHIQVNTNDIWLAGIEEEITEQIEIIQGASSVGYPVYGIVDFDYLERHLGALSFSEDGTIQTDIEGQSLLSITYKTKYRQWEVIDTRVEDVQFIIGEA